MTHVQYKEGWIAMPAQVALEMWVAALERANPTIR